MSVRYPMHPGAHIDPTDPANGAALDALEADVLNGRVTALRRRDPGKGPGEFQMWHGHAMVTELLRGTQGPYPSAQWLRDHPEPSGSAKR
jgi:hypothetical protein